MVGVYIIHPTSLHSLLALESGIGMVGVEYDNQLEKCNFGRFLAKNCVEFSRAICFLLFASRRKGITMGVKRA